MVPRRAHHHGRLDESSRAGDLLAHLRTKVRAFLDNDRVLNHSPGSSANRNDSGGYMSRNREWRKQTRAEFRRSVSETASRLRGRGGS